VRRSIQSRSSWRRVPIPELAEDAEGHLRAVRLNSLGSLYFSAKHLLNYSRLTTLHKQLCASLESEHLFLVMEVPMSHFKTRLGIALSIWWALPFTDEDEKFMRDLGYGDSWIRYMRAMHNQNTRTLVTHEIAEQAAAIGRDVDATYENNDLFRKVFAEIIPDRSCTWTNHHKFQKRLPGADATTGTFEYRGVGQALQGIHVNSVVQDDNFGKEAQTSLLKGDGRVVDDLIRWHQQVGTRFDPIVKKARRQLVIGNAWAHHDLNAYIKANQPEFKFETHSAQGGCCKVHPEGKPILPSEWTMELLQRERERLGKYDYSHFYLNIRTLPEEQLFDVDCLNYFKFKKSRPELRDDDLRNILLLEHEVKNGEVINDFQPGGLIKRIIVDPNHAKKVKRTEHVIWGLGYDPETKRIYLLSLYAEDSKYSDLVEEIYRTAKRWQVDSVWMGELSYELLAFYLGQREREEVEYQRRRKVKNISTLTINTFPDDHSQTGMKNRIEALEPLIRGEQIWAHRYQEKFISQLGDYPTGALDTLDVLGNFPETISVEYGVDEFMEEQRSAFLNRGSGEGGY
jgi:hypothetical protein